MDMKEIRTGEKKLWYKVIRDRDDYYGVQVFFS